MRHERFFLIASRGSNTIVFDFPHSYKVRSGPGVSAKAKDRRIKVKGAKLQASSRKGWTNIRGFALLLPSFPASNLFLLSSVVCHLSSDYDLSTMNYDLSAMSFAI